MSCVHCQAADRARRVQRTLAVYQRVRALLQQQYGEAGVASMLTDGSFAAMVKIELMNQGLLPPMLETSDGVYRFEVLLSLRVFLSAQAAG
jgi:hypothetical protein